MSQLIGAQNIMVEQGLSFLNLEITLPFAKLCHAFEDFFFYHHDFMTKAILSCLKMNLKISHELR